MRSMFYLFRLSPMPIAAMKLFPHTSELFLVDNVSNDHLSHLIDPESSMSLRVPWSLLTKISISAGTVVSAEQLEGILRLANRVHTLLLDGTGEFTRAILRRNQHLCAFLNRQVRISTFDKPHSHVQFLSNRYVHYTSSVMVM